MLYYFSTLDLYYNFSSSFVLEIGGKMRFLLCKMNERTVCNMLLIFNRYKYGPKTDYKTTISNQRDHIFQLMRSQLTKKPASPPTN